VQSLGTILDLALVILGFGLIIFFHELGHFLAARWAGIRILTFAIGFGPAICSYRRGLGWRRGSSEREYLALPNPASVSPTEYRLNWLPLGGYVRMLGQDDANPSAVSDAPDSYQRCRPWKRMVVISAGVIANLIVAAVIFMFVFKVGIRTDPPVVGDVIPGTPAARAMPLDAPRDAEPGLRPGDHIVEIGGRRARSFNDVLLASAMASPGRPVALLVERDGLPLRFDIVPEVGRLTGTLELGVTPPASATLRATRPGDEQVLAEARRTLDRLGLVGVPPGARLVRAGDQADVTMAAQVSAAFRESGGRPVRLDFATDSGTISLTLEPRPRLAADLVPMPGGQFQVLEHLLGLSPVMRVAEGTEPSKAQGLAPGDVFLRAGGVEYPSVPRGIAEIRGRAGRTVELTVLRRGEAGIEVVERTARVSRDGRVGFFASSTAEESTLLSQVHPRLVDLREGSEPRAPPAASLAIVPGSRVISVFASGSPPSGETRRLRNFADLRASLREATRAAFESGQDAAVTLTLELPTPDLSSAGVVERLEWTIPADEVRALHALGWESPLPTSLFQPAEFLLRASGPLDALRTGLAETHRVMMMTYVTLARLFQGTVKVEHLRGPVGIAHLGTLIADRGLVWLLFFLALISVNLAVINFLPLPIVDGGQFIFLLIEQIRGRPAPMAVQNAATVIGLALIGTVFVVVTFNDVMNLLGR
jgi:regulator of sigma E protease